MERPAGEAAEAIERAAAAYALATGVPCLAADAEGGLVTGRRTGTGAPSASEGDGSLGCTLCRDLADMAPSGASPPSCAEILRYGMLQAERFGGAYIYFCPLSLLHWSAVVRRDGQVVGALTAGPVIAVDRDEFVAEDLAGKYAIPPEHRPRLESLIAAMAQAGAERVKALADILEAAARDLGAALEGRVDLHAAAARESAHIAEYIQELKEEWFGGDSRGARRALSRGYPFHKERELIRLVASGDRAGASGLLNEILGAVFFEGGGEIGGARARALELVVLLSRAAVEGGALPEEIFGLSEDTIRGISTARSIDDLAASLSVVLGRFVDSVFALKRAKHADSLLKAQRIIRERYAEDLRLGQVAREVGFSPAYFSTLFKEEAGRGFAAYLAAVRVARAKQFLKDRDIALVDVAGMAGFQDQSYFGRVFKSIVGVTPGRFRSGRLSPEEGIEIHGGRG